MSHTGLPDFPITPILTRRGIDSLRRNLSFKPPYASTPIHRPSDVSAENGERGKGKAAVVLKQQNEATGKPLKGQHQRSSEVVLDLQSKVLGIRNRPLGAKPAVSGMKRLATDADTIQAAVQKLVMIGKTVSTSIDKTTATSKGDAQRKLGGQAGTKASLVAQSKGELKEKGCLELMLGSAKPWDSATTVASEPGKGAEKSVRKNENAPRLEETTKGTSSGRETTEREGSETSARRKENALRVDDTIQTKGNSRVPKGGKRAGKTGMRNENDPSLDDTIQNTDNHVGRFSKRNSVNNLQEMRLEPVHKVTRKVSESVGSMQVRTGHDNKADRKTLTIRVIASKGLPAKDSESSLGSIQVNSDSDQRTAKAVNSNQTEGKLLTRALNPRSLKTKENNLKSQPMHIIKSAVALTTASANIVKTTARKSSLHVVNNSTAEKERASAVTQNSTNVVKTTAHESSGRVDNVIATEKEQPSVSALSNVQLPPGKSSAKNNPKVVTSQVSASQGVDSERLSSEVANSVVTNFDSGSSEGNDQETLTEPASVKTRAVKRLASAEISSDLEDSADASDSSLRQNNKRKKRKVVTESFTEHSKEELPSVSTQPERRFLKEKVSRPTKVLVRESFIHMDHWPLFQLTAHIVLLTDVALFVRNDVCDTMAQYQSFLVSYTFILDISIAPLQILNYSEVLQTTALILYRS